MSKLENLREAGIQPWLCIQQNRLSFVFIERWPDAMKAASAAVNAVLNSEDARLALRNELVSSGCISPRRPYPEPYELAARPSPA
jgi:hypothetical protein